MVSHLRVKHGTHKPSRRSICGGQTQQVVTYIDYGNRMAIEHVVRFGEVAYAGIVVQVF